MNVERPDPAVKLTSREEFRFLADLILKHSSGDHTLVALHDQHGGATRFANNQVVQNVNQRRVTLAVTVAFGQRHGTASTSDLTVGGVQDALKRAEAVARVSPPDPEYLPPVEPQTYPSPPTWRPETAAGGPARRLADARTAIELCQERALAAAGLVASSVSVVALAANTGLFAYEPRTEARFSVTAARNGATGWAATAHRSFDRLDVAGRTRTAIEKAIRSEAPKDLPAGRYTVILEPAAVVGLWSWLLWQLDAKAYDRRTSPFADRLGQPVVDRRLTLRNEPEHPDLLGAGFTGDGLPSLPSTWIESGVLKQLLYDRFTARQHGVAPIPTLDAPVLSGDAAAAGVEDLIGTTERGILVTNFWYIRMVNPTDLTLTGMTRDGTFLIEDGRLAAPVRNFRFHESPLRAFAQVEACTGPIEAQTVESVKMLVPAVKVREFYFSSVTRF
ncbi:TldD/PmbA family protein [Nitrospira sp. Kam-Ns4a]